MIIKDSTSKHQELSSFYKALAHPARLAIIEILLRTKTCTCNDFVNRIPFAQATISEHLRKLKLAQLISVWEKGSSSQYAINKQVFKRCIELQRREIELHLFLYPSV
jgi:DNA-binding transcriptional ArsR family regulator